MAITRSLNPSRAGWGRCMVMAGLAAATLCRAHGGVDALHGRVTGPGGEPLAGVRIEVSGSSGHGDTVSGSDGGFRFAALAAGTYDIVVSRTGFLTKTIPAITLVHGRSRRLDIRLRAPEPADKPVTPPPPDPAIDGDHGPAEGTPEVHGDTPAHQQGGEGGHDHPGEPHDHGAADAGAHDHAGEGHGHDHDDGKGESEDHAGHAGHAGHTDHHAGEGEAHDHGSSGEGGHGGHGGPGHHHGAAGKMDAQAGELAPEFGDPATVKNPQFRGLAAGWHGSISAEYAPLRWNGGGGAVTRPFGLGGRTYAAGSDRAQAGFEIGGPLFTDKLFIFAAYQSHWDADYYHFTVDPAELVRDEVTAEFANQRFDLGNTRSHPYRIQLTWQPHPRHRIDLLYRGAPATTRGTLRSVSRRLDPRDASGIYTQPEPNGVPIIDPGEGASGSARSSDGEFAVRYLGTFGSGMSIEARHIRHRRRRAESPEVDELLYDDYRRKQVYNAFTEFGVPHIVSPAQYFFGGLGRFTDNSGDQGARTLLKFSHPFRAAGAHELKYGAEYSDLRFRENTLFSGPRGADRGVELYLGTVPSGDSPEAPGRNPDSFIRLRTGGMMQLTCFRSPSPIGTDLITACYKHRYTLIGGAFSPERPDTRARELNLFAQDTWQAGPLTFTFGVRFTRTELDSPNGYTLTSSRTGKPLIGADGFPVGSIDPNTPQNEPAPPYRPAKPKYLAGPGEFVGGAYRFPWEPAPRFGISWDITGDGRARLYANYSRLVESVDDHLAGHVFENEFRHFRADFSYPDLTNQSSPASTSSGNATAIQPGTRMGTRDDFLLGARMLISPRWLFDLRGRVLKQDRILALSQNTPAEAAANFYFDRLVADGVCMNCAPGQTTLFPGYPQGNSAAFNNPDARGLLTHTLVNPGRNTPDGLFGKPSRRVESLVARLERIPAEGQRWSGHAELRLARASGNYEGPYARGNGYSHEEQFTLFDYPMSPLTRGQYAEGSLPLDNPASLRVHLAGQDLLLKNLSGSLTLNWRRGGLRTPLLALPTSQYLGDVPGTEPDYYQFDVDRNGLPDRKILRDYRDVPRGFAGRNPDRTTLDAGLDYRFRLFQGNLRFSLRVDNLLNARRPTGYDDFVETDVGITDTAVPAATRGPDHDPAGAEPVSRIANPEYGLPVSVEAPRTFRLGVSWSF